MKTKILIFSLFFIGLLIIGLFSASSVNAFYGTVVMDAYEDTYITGGSHANTNHEGLDYLNVGFPSTRSTAYFRYNLTDMQAEYDYGHYNDNVHIRIYGGFNFGDTDFLTVDWKVYRIIEEWDVSTVTYNDPAVLSSLLYNYTLTKSEPWASGEFVYLDITEDLDSVFLNASGTVMYYGYAITFDPVGQGYASWLVNSIEAGIYEGSIVYGYDEDEEAEGEYEGVITGEFLTNWFIYAIFLVVLPIAMTAFISNLGEHANPTLMLVTFLGSETLMSAISLSIGLIDLWFMLVVIIVDVLIILGLMKGRG